MRFFPSKVLLPFCVLQLVRCVCISSQILFHFIYTTVPSGSLEALLRYSNTTAYLNRLAPRESSAYVHFVEGLASLALLVVAIFYTVFFLRYDFLITDKTIRLHNRALVRRIGFLRIAIEVARVFTSLVICHQLSSDSTPTVVQSVHPFMHEINLSIATSFYWLFGCFLQILFPDRCRTTVLLSAVWCLTDILFFFFDATVFMHPFHVGCAVRFHVIRVSTYIVFCVPQAVCAFMAVLLCCQFKDLSVRFCAMWFGWILALSKNANKSIYVNSREPAGVLWRGMASCEKKITNFRKLQNFHAHPLRYASRTLSKQTNK